MNIAIIPARGGSKRIPRKNIRDFAGKPMIAHAIAAASESGMFKHVVVSTDDDEISQIARECGAVTPFVRPLELSDDYTPTVPVIAHAIKACRALGWDVKYACCIYPGVPLINVDDLKSSYDLLKTGFADYSFAITEYPSVIQRALRRDENGKTTPFYPEFETTRTQDLETTYYDAGQFYWGKAEAWLRNENIHSNGVGHYIPSSRVIDIDTPEDWSRAELFYKVFQMEKTDE